MSYAIGIVPQSNSLEISMGGVSGASAFCLRKKGSQVTQNHICLIHPYIIMLLEPLYSIKVLCACFKKLSTGPYKAAKVKCIEHFHARSEASVHYHLCLVADNSSSASSSATALDVCCKVTNWSQRGIQTYFVIQSLPFTSMTTVCGVARILAAPLPDGQMIQLQRLFIYRCFHCHSWSGVHSSVYSAWNMHETTSHCHEWLQFQRITCKLMGGGGVGSSNGKVMILLRAGMVGILYKFIVVRV